MVHFARRGLFRKRPKPIKCKAPDCQQTFLPQRQGQRVCSWECGLALTRRQNEKAADKRRRQEARELKERKLALKTPQQVRSAEIQKAEAAVRRYVRIRDEQDPCISCGASILEVESGPRLTGGYWDAGHYHSKGSVPALRFNTWNIHKQCKICNGGENRHRNSYKNSSVRKGYTAGLRQKVGQARLDWLDGPHPPLQPDVEYLQRVNRIFSKRARHLKKLRERTKQ